MSRPQLSGVEVRHLQALQGVVEEGSFRGAAERLGYTQGSVSAQIGALEQMIGTALLERAPGRPVRLTPAGEAFYPHALDALVRLRTGADEAGSAETTRTAARLRLGAYPSAAARLLPPLLDRLAEACPEADVTLTESVSPEELERAVEAGQLDLTSVYTAAGEEPLPLVIGVSFTRRAGRWLAVHNQDSQGPAKPANPPQGQGR